MGKSETQRETADNRDLPPGDPGPRGYKAAYVQKEAKMSRKRFVKLLMGAGFSRDGALAAAAFVRGSGFHYAAYCWSTLTGLELTKWRSEWERREIRKAREADGRAEESSV